MTIPPHTNPEPGEAIVEIRLFFGDESTRMAQAHFKGLPKGRKQRAKVFVERAPAVIAALITEYLKR